MNCPNDDPECKNRLVKTTGQSKTDQLFGISVAGDLFSFFSFVILGTLCSTGRKKKRKEEERTEKKKKNRRRCALTRSILGTLYYPYSPTGRDDL
jgi:hypothetical protein